MRKWLNGLVLGLLSVGLVSSVAGAHAVVYPKTATAGSYEKFIMRVPTEKASATIKVKVEIPAGFEVRRVKPMPGWTYEMEKAADGKLAKSITWSGGKILAGEFQEFEFQGKTAKDPGKYAFRAWQTYEDGETVEWTGPSDAKTPASVMELKPGAAKGDGHGAPAAPATTPAPSAPPAPAAPASNPVTTGAAYGGLLLGAAALVLALRKR